METGHYYSNRIHRIGSDLGLRELSRYGPSTLGACGDRGIADPILAPVKVLIWHLTRFDLPRVVLINCQAGRG